MISFSKTVIGKEEIESVVKVLKSGWLTMGEETLAFEEEFANYVGTKFAVALNSCTAGLFLSLKALGIGIGDEVIVPSFTFASTVNVVVHSGAIPVFADIKKDDFTLDPKSVERLITKKTKAIMPVHYAGRKAFINYELPVVEDSAHLIPKSEASKNLTAYSFYATKNMTTGEGGMITTDDEKLAIWLRKARLHGMSKDAWKRYDNQGKWRYDIEFPGYKLNTTDLNSSLGRVQLRRLPVLQTKRTDLVHYYNKLLGLSNTGNHLYPILVENRDEFIEDMANHGVQCSVHFIPVHTMTAYKNCKVSLPNTEYIGDRVVTLPLHPLLSQKDIEYVSKLVIKFAKGSKFENKA
ncbi:MAG: DegT/DnrJ/EryC1/StrS family aminotransferase [Candidatus Levybacteria bacterium]|nr:DegT/DnrJ/EryC1/StrS family aminotransferase [Candidatus Levybacteria bacterium]